MVRTLNVVFVLGLAACSSNGSTSTDGDAGPRDAGGAVDAPRPVDAAPAGPDARLFDAGPQPDAGPTPTIGGCQIFPPNDPWNQDVLGVTVDQAWTDKLYANRKRNTMHPDFGDGFGIPINVVPANEPKLAITFDIDDESDPGPYPFPPTVDIEGGTPTSCGGDCHVLVVQQGVCTLWEAYACELAGSTWSCGSGAKFNLGQVGPGQRPDGWTSADAAGLAITPGLVRYAEVAAGSVNHAIRFTMHCIQDGYVYPASHQAVSRGPNNCDSSITTAILRDQYPPMGTRIRLNPAYPTAGMPQQARVIAEAMKRYGLILADNGSDYFFQGDDNPGWDQDQLDALKAIPASQLQVLQMGPIQR